MTVPTDNDRNSYTGNGSSTSFSFDYRLISTSHMTVYKDGVLVSSSLYTVAIDPSGVGGTVTFTTAPANGVVVVLLRVQDLLQEDHLKASEPLPPATLERMVDKNSINIQQLNTKFKSSLRLAPSVDPNVVNSVLALPAAGQVIRWNLAGNGLENVSAAQAFNDSVPAGGGGNVLGPVSSTDYSPALWNGTNGQTLRNSGSLGSSGDVYTSNGAGVAPSFQTIPGTPELNNYRLSLSTGVAIPTTDVTAATTVYLTPYKGNGIALYDGTKWVTRRPGEISIAVPSSQFRIYDVFCYDNAGTPTLETLAWDASQTTGTITGVSVGANPVVTAANSLSVGDLVGIAGITGTIGTDATKGLNGEVWRVTAVTGTNFTIGGADTTSLAYTSGGTFFKIPTSRNTALVKQNGVWCKTGALTRRWVGSFMTTGTSGQTEDTLTSRLITNADDNLVKRIMSLNENTSHTKSTATWEPWRLAQKLARFRFLQGQPDRVHHISAACDASQASNGEVTLYLSVDLINAQPAQPRIYSSMTTAFVSRITPEGEIMPAAGFHNVVALETAVAIATINNLNMFGSIQG